MNYYISLGIAYVVGGITFIPIILIICYILSKYIGSTAINPAQQPSDTLEQQFHKDHLVEHSQFYKVGWLHVIRDAQATSKGSSIGGIVKSYLSGSGGKTATATINEEYSSNNLSMTADNSSNSFYYFAVLKFNTLYLYDSELQLDCKGVINVSNHQIQVYPHGLKDHELFSKSSRIQLKKKMSNMYQENQQQEYYLHCNRCVDKEDWFIALLRASKLELTSSQHGEPPTKDLQRSLENSTQFDQDAMNHLISTIHSDPSHFELQWFNALLGRIFLGIYKTDRTKSFFYNKILKKIEKLNARRPPFLEEISLRSVDGGHAAPQITKPRFIHLSPQGEYTGDVQLFYDGHFRVELETVLKWKYSDRLPPIRIDLVLAITLKSIEGKMMIKIKEPPTNRAWMGFYKKPKMEWVVEPVVWEKRIGYSLVSKAIKTKIEEIFTETMVLPNMDDMVFFQTEGGAGGIFGKDETVNKALNSGVTNLSYHSLPELYSSPSDLVRSAFSPSQQKDAVAIRAAATIVQVKIKITAKHWPLGSQCSAKQH
ncbi:putative integral membrane protein conserved region-domain-containing protein [Parasitella parasitica]|nr:putative integral membrane protein conserved region-domain-containing protein [Parasitella parasitica]